MNFYPKKPQVFQYWFHDTMLDSHYVYVCGLDSSLSNSQKTSLRNSVFYHHRQENCFDIYRILYQELYDGFIHSKHHILHHNRLNFRSINNFSIFSPDMIIFYFCKGVNVFPNHYINESAQFITFTDSVSYFLFSTINFPGIYFIYFSGGMCLLALTSTFFPFGIL